MCFHFREVYSGQPTPDLCGKFAGQVEPIHVGRSRLAGSVTGMGGHGLQHTPSGHHGGCVVMRGVRFSRFLDAAGTHQSSHSSAFCIYFGAVSVRRYAILSGAHSCETYWAVALDLLRPF